MPRRARIASGGYAYHIINRGAGRNTLFHQPADYDAFLKILAEAMDERPTRLCAFCVMPNHWHLVLWPERDGEMSEFMRWLTVTHAQRLHAFRGTSGTGPVYQGRFRSFPIEQDHHFLLVCRYVERNAMRAGLVGRAEQWRWGSAWQRQAAQGVMNRRLAPWPVARPSNWLDVVNQPISESELEALRTSIKRGSPFGEGAWQRSAASELGLEATLRPPGRPKKGDGSRFFADRRF